DAHGDLDAGRLALVRGDGLRPVGGEVEALGTLRLVRQRRDPHDPRDAVRAQLVVVRGDEVPGARLQDEAQRVQRAGDDVVTAVVVDLQAATIPDAFADRRQVGDGLAGAEPAGGVQVEALEEPGRASAQLRGQGGEHLQAGAGDHRAQAELRRRPG